MKEAESKASRLPGRRPPLPEIPPKAFGTKEIGRILGTSAKSGAKRPRAPRHPASSAPARKRSSAKRPRPPRHPPPPAPPSHDDKVDDDKVKKAKVPASKRPQPPRHPPPPCKKGEVDDDKVHHPPPPRKEGKKAKVHDDKGKKAKVDDDKVDADDEVDDDLDNELCDWTRRTKKLALERRGSAEMDWWSNTSRKLSSRFFGKGSSR